MSEERKKIGIWPWIVALLIGLPVLYVANYGPYCWLLSRNLDSEILRPIGRFYRPLARITITGPYWIGDSLFWYSNLGATEEMRRYSERILPNLRQVYRQYGFVP